MYDYGSQTEIGLRKNKITERIDAHKYGRATVETRTKQGEAERKGGPPSEPRPERHEVPRREWD